MGRLSEPEKDILLWLGESAVHSYLVPDLPNILAPRIDEIERLMAAEQPWARDLARFETKLDYEPRSLATSPSGTTVAVGTKSGQLVIAEKDASGAWSCRPCRIPLASIKKPAIRGLAFVDDTTLLVTSILDRAGIVTVGSADPELPHWKDAGLLDVELRPTWVLADPQTSRLGFAFSSDGVRVIGPDGQLQRKEPGSVFETWKDEEALVSGRLVHDSREIVLLGSRGTLSCFAVSDKLPMQRTSTLRLTGLGANQVFHRVSKFPNGLAILAGSYVGVVRFEGPRLIQDKRWVHVPGARDISAWIPFFDQRPGNVLAVYVATEAAGVVILRWPFDREDAPIGQQTVILPSDDPVTRVLHLGVRTSPGPHGRGPAILAVATGDHRLLISSLLDSTQVNSVLRKRLSDIPDGAGKQFVAAWSELRHLERNSEYSPDVSELSAAELIRLATSLAGHLNSDAWNGKMTVVYAVIRPLLSRAHQLGSGDRDWTFRRIADILEQVLVRREYRPQFTRFLQNYKKWIVSGQSYSEKHTDLERLCEWNDSRDLDRLNYLTRLIRGRVDLLWRFRDEPRQDRATWHVAVMQGPSHLCVRTLTDGRVSACRISTDAAKSELTAATSLRFSAKGTVADELSTSGLAIVGGSLERIGATGFRQRHFHGPYSRSLSLTPVGEDGRFVMAFATRGWRTADEASNRSGPRFHVLFCEMDADNAVRILAATGQDLHPQQDVHCLERYGREATGSGTRLSFVAGTLGPFQGEEFELTPFLDVEVIVRRAATASPSIDLTLSALKVESDAVRRRSQAGQRVALTATDRNPCWAIVVRRGEKQLWAGFGDGTVRFYERLGKTWREARDRRFEAGGPVRSLAESADGSLLAYGTTNGRIGVLRFDRHASEVPLVHAAERHPITALAFYSELQPASTGDSAEQDRLVHRLFAASQDGRIGIYSLDAEPLRLGETRFYQGQRVDRPHVETGVNSVAVLPRGDQQRPYFLLGCRDGSLLCLDVLYPRDSRRRERAQTDSIRRWNGVVKNFDKQGVGPAEALRWLRALNVGGDHLFRFSLWREMVGAGDLLRKATKRFVTSQTDVDSSVREFEDAVKAFLNTVDELADEGFRRRPFSREPAKILWEEGARQAKRLAKRGVRSKTDPSKANGLLRESLEIHERIDALCNRWIGHHQGAEEAVLAHSFKYLFRGVDVRILLFDVESREAEALRRFLVFVAVQRRLIFGGAVVPVETVSVLNAALLEHLYVKRLQPDPEGSQVCYQDQRTTLYDLALLVGELGRKSAATLDIAELLFSELVRFFALLICVAPGHTMLWYHVISESRLVRKERASFSSAVILEARRLSRMAHPVHAARIAEQLDVFEAASEVRSAEVRQAWATIREAASRMTGEGSRRADSGANGAFLSEMATAVHVAETLAEGGRDALKQCGKDLEGLGRFFVHSRTFFERIGKERAAGTAKRGVELLREYDNQLDALSVSEELFEPQRSQYATILTSWRRQDETTLVYASEIISVFDRFNRHAYRAKAERLLTAATELSAQRAPRWPAAERDEPAFVGPEDRADDLAQAILAGAQHLVFDSKLFGALLTVASASLSDHSGMDDQQRRRDLWRGAGNTLDATRLRAVWQERAEFLNIEVHFDDFAPSACEAPGNATLWAAIAGELMMNAVKHSGSDRPSQASLQTEGRSTRLAFHGATPFVNTLQRDYRLELEREQDKRAFLNRLAASCIEHGKRVSTSADQERADGYGLTMVRMVCRYLGIEARCLLEEHKPYQDAALVTRLEWFPAEAPVFRMATP